MKTQLKSLTRKTKTINIAVLISGRGSNMLALHKKIQKGSLKNVNISIVISDSKESVGLAKANALGLPTALVDRKDFNSQEDFENKLVEIIKQKPIDLLVLAGFMQILSSKFITQFNSQIINIHPSLLPKYRGLHTHKRVLEAKDSKHGLTIHMIMSEVDNGAIIMQKEISVDYTDTEESLAHKVLTQEHIFLPLVTQLIAQEDIKLYKDKVFYQNWQLSNKGIICDENNSVDIDVVSYATLRMQNIKMLHD